MKKIFILFTIGLCQVSISNAQKLNGVYTEYKCTLWNGEDGAKYTYNMQAFKPVWQFVFNDNKNKEMVEYDEGYNSKKNYEIVGDTLLLKIDVGEGKYKRTEVDKYIMLKTGDELVLLEYKPLANENSYVKKHYFKKAAALNKDYLKKDDYDKFTVVESMPEYPGGVTELMKFIAGETAKAPVKEKQTVYVKMLINPQGKIESTEIINVNAVGLNYAEEAMKIVRKFADFTPGKQGGKTCYVYYNIPIRFAAK